MQYRNDGSREEYQIQNQFTAYLQVALKRRKNAYLSQRHRQQQHERPMEPDRQPISAEAWEDEYFRRMELLMEYRAVLEALTSFKSVNDIFCWREFWRSARLPSSHRNYRLDIKARLRSIIAH